MHIMAEQECLVIVNSVSLLQGEEHIVDYYETLKKEFCGNKDKLSALASQLDLIWHTSYILLHLSVGPVSL